LPPLDEHDEARTVHVSFGLSAADDVGVVRHTWRPAAAAAGRVASSVAGASSDAARSSLRVLSFNVWNVNPSRWLWRSPHERWRQYALRMMHVGDILRRGAPDIVALQEVRYDSTLGGRDPPPPPAAAQDPLQPLPATASLARGPPASYAAALRQAHAWYNASRAIGGHAKYAERNQRHWDAVLASPLAAQLAAHHPFEATTAASLAEADDATRSASSPLVSASISASGDVAGAGGHSDSGPPASPASPYARGSSEPRGPASYAAVAAAAARHPHAQLEHLAVHLGGGYQFVHAPAQLYLDPGRWLAGGEPHIDAEGPAIFSRWPIVAADALLLSRDPADEGDGHQRLCLHAVVDATGSLSSEGAAAEPGGRLLVDVYTVHLALSERARNRTVPELREFVRRSARGAVQVLTGDMNAEPHEPAMRWLAGAMPEGEELLVAPPAAAAAAAAAAEGVAPQPLAPVAARVEAGMRDADCLLADRGCDAAVAAAAAARLPPPSYAGAGAGGGAGKPAGGPVALADAFTLVHGPGAEPAPRSPDAAVRRYLHTFPSDDPVKRIDLVLLAAAPGLAAVAQPAGAGREGGSSSGAAAAGGGAATGGSSGAGAASSSGAAWRATPQRLFLLGQDALPGTEAQEGRGAGMSSLRSPVYASDHRAVALDLLLERMQQQ